MNKPKPPSLRETMPNTAEWVDRMREQHGAAHVNEQIRLSLAGTPGRFYAIERGQVLGTPFEVSDNLYAEQRVALIFGSTFAGFIADPRQGGNDGAR